MTEPASAQPAIAGVSQGGALPRGAVGVGAYYLAHFLAAVFPVTAGLLLYGWRALAVIGLVMGVTLLATTIWRDIGLRGGTLSYLDNLWYALLLALMLPATLLSAGSGLAIVTAAALLMVMLRWALPAIGHWMMHPALLAYLLIAGAFSGSLNADRILNRDHLLVGELMHAGAPADRAAGADSWYARAQNPTDADYVEHVADHLTRYTRGLETPTRRWLPLSVLLRDIMPPLEDFIVAGQPGPIGASSALAVIICGLFLLYRGVIDFRIPLIGCLSAYVSFIMLPIPTVIAAGPQWHWAVFRLPEVGPAVAITFVNYEMLASPLIFMLFLLATTPVVCPMKRRSRTIFALALGIVAAAFQLYVSVSYGPYLALLLVSVLSAELDRWLGTA